MGDVGLETGSVKECGGFEKGGGTVKEERVAVEKDSVASRGRGAVASNDYGRAFVLQGRGGT